MKKERISFGRTKVLRYKREVKSELLAIASNSDFRLESFNA